MKLSLLVKQTCLLPNLKSKTRWEALEEMLKQLAAEDCLESEDLSFDEILEALREREREQSTGTGEGYAFPHARLNNLKKTYVVIGFSKEGVEFDAADRKPAHVIIMFLVDRQAPEMLLLARAAVIRFFLLDGNRDKCVAATSQEEIWSLIDESNINVDYEITAKDLMRPQLATLSPDMTLREAAREFHRAKLDTLPIIDSDRKFVCELSCHDLFSFGLPDFFSNLHVISFVKHMNPFEKYFMVDKTMTISELVKSKKTDAPTIDHDATLMEIIFEMSVKNHELLYIVDDNDKLHGVLDRYSIIDKILVAR